LKNEIIINGKSHRYSWLNTVFIQVADYDLVAKIGEKVQELNCDLEIGRKDFPDLMAVPFFIGIVDRRLVGSKMWEETLGFRKEYGGHKPLIVVDIENGVDTIKTKNVVYTDSHDQILNIITNKKTWLNRIEFIYYNRVYKWFRWQRLYLSDAWDRLLGRDQ
jgi:hypothetical protein